MKVSEYLKNHSPKLRLVCTHSDAFLIQIPNLHKIICSHFLTNFMKNFKEPSEFAKCAKGVNLLSLRTPGKEKQFNSQNQRLY